MENKIKWGVIGSGVIARRRTIPEGITKAENAKLVAVFDINPEANKAVATEFNAVPVDSIQNLINSDVDAIYIASPANMHLEQAIACAKGKKHVLCEKPLALSLADVDAIAAAATRWDKVVSEAFVYRSHPQALKVKQLIDSGALGKIKIVRGSFTYPDTSPDNYRLKPEMGGGGLWDVGCYPINYMRTMLGLEPDEVFGWQVIGPTGVDEVFAAQMHFPGDVFAQFDCSTVIPYHVFMEFIGDMATLVIPNPFIPGPNRSLYLVRNGKTKTIFVKGPDTYISEVENIADAILFGQTPAVSMVDSRHNIAAILALFESAKTGKPVRL